MRTGQFETDTARAASIAKKRAKEIERSFNDAASSIRGAFATLTAGLTVGAIVQFAKSTLQGVDAMNDLADATGASVENISALDDLARRTGTNLDTVGGILVKFNAALKDGDPSKGPGAVLKALGLDVEKLKKLDPAEALRQTAVALSKFSDDGDKARAVQELFGKSIREAGPYLKDLAEKGELNATVTKRQAEETEAFNKLVFGLQADIVGLARSIVSDLIPSVSNLIREMSAGIQIFGGFWAALRNVGTTNPFNTPLEQLKKFEQAVVEAKANLAKTEAKAAAPGLFGLGLDQSRRIENQREELANAEKLLAYQRKILGITNGAAGGGRGFVNPTLELPKLNVPTGATTKKITGNAKAEIDKVAEALEKLERELALFGQSDSFIKAFNLDGMGATTAQLESYRANLAKLSDLKTEEDIQKVIDALAKERDELGLTSDEIKINQLVLQGASQAQIEYAQAIVDATKAQREANELSEEGKRITEEFRTPLEVLTDRYKTLNYLLAAGAIGQDTYRRAVDAAQDSFTKATEPVEKLGKEIDSFAKRAAENIQDAIGDGLVDAMEGNFKNIGASFAKMITRMVAEAAAADIARKLFGDSVKGGEGSGFFGDILKSIGSAFGGAKASGGDVIGGRSYLVGEQGPERFVPRTAGTILPANQTGQRGGDTYIDMGGIRVDSHGAIDRMGEDRAARNVARKAQVYLTRRGA